MSVASLKTLCLIRHGGTPSKANPIFWKGDIPWVSPKDMKASVLHDASDHITQEAVENSATSVVPEKSILVVIRSGILAHSLPVAQVARPVAFNQDIKALMPDLAKVDPDYLYWFLRAQGPLVLRQGVKKGATVHSLQSGFIENLQVPLPPRAEQRRIVDLLSRAEGIVRLRHEAEKCAAELIPALFLDLFGDPATNPKRWPVASVGDVIAAADYGSSTKASDDGSGLPFIRMGNVDYAGTLDLSGLKFVNLPAKEVEKYRLREGDILFNRTNSKELVGKTGLWNDARDAVVASYFIRVRVQRDKLHPCYFWAFMNSPHMKRVLFGTARGAIGQANINSKELKAFTVALPPLSLQETFAAKVDDVRSIQSQQSAASAKTQAAFDALLAGCFATNKE